MNDTQCLRNSQKYSLHYEEEAALLRDPSHPFTTAAYRLSARQHNKTSGTRTKNSTVSMHMEGYRKACWSPSCCPALPSCILLVLTVDGHAFLYTKETSSLYSSMKIFFNFNYYLESLAEIDFDLDKYMVKCK